MSKYLINVTEVYRVDTEGEASELIKEAKEDTSYALTKYSTVKKERKSKGEIIDEWHQVILVKRFNEEKEPSEFVTVTYEVE
jgi:hypothetical protein